jgi:hypothetical protein
MLHLKYIEMSKKQVTISVYAKEELKNKFEEVFQESEFNSKGEMFGAMLEGYLSPSENYDEDLRDTLKELRAENANLKKEIIEMNNNDNIKENDQPDDDELIILPTTPEQTDIIRKCYDDNEEYESEIIKDLVKMACQFVKIRQGGLFSDDQYTRLFALKGISVEDFEAAFPDELIAIGETVERVG